MKIAINIFYFIFTFFFAGVEPSEEIVAALKQGKSSELVKYFNEKAISNSYFRKRKRWK